MTEKEAADERSCDEMVIIMRKHKSKGGKVDFAAVVPELAGVLAEAHFIYGQKIRELEASVSDLEKRLVAANDRNDRLQITAANAKQDAARLKAENAELINTLHQYADEHSWDWLNGSLREWMGYSPDGEPTEGPDLAIEAIKKAKEGNET